MRNDELRARFGALRRVDGAAAPEFSSVVDRVSAGHTKATPHRSPVVWFAAAAAVVVGLFAMQRFRATSDTSAQSITTWQSPTSSLVPASGRAVLVAVPASLVRSRRCDIVSALAQRRLSMRTTLVPFAFVLLSSATLAQQPAPTRPSPGQASVAVCPIYVIDGKTIAPAAADCVPVPAPAARGVPPDWTAPVPPPAADPLARFLFPPELVMAHQEAIGLTDKQRSAIQAAVKDAQAKVVDRSVQDERGGREAAASPSDLHPRRANGT